MPPYLLLNIIRTSGHEVTPRELQQQMKSSHQPVVVDVRSPEAYAACHIDHSINITAHELHPDALPHIENRKIILVCADGLESAHIKQQLRQTGYDVYNLSGGITSWRKQSLPVVRA